MAKPRPPSVKIYEEHDANEQPLGIWHGFITLGKKPSGRPNVVHRQGPSYDVVADKIRAAEDEYAATKKVAPVASPKLADYLAEWLAEGQAQIPPRWSYSGHKDYRLAVNRYIVPRLGGHTLRELEAQFKLCRTAIGDVGKEVSPHAAAKAHRVLRAALNDAFRDELLDRNPMDRVQEPRPKKSRAVGGLTLQEAEAIKEVLAKRPRDRGRFELAMMLGQRQGECLGLMVHRPESPRTPPDVDLAARRITVRQKLYREAYEHGCLDPHACGAAPRKHYPLGLHVPRNAPCPGAGPKHARYHKKGCPPARGTACKPGCTGHAKACKDRVGGLKRAEPKSRSGERVMVIPLPLVESLTAWEAVKAADKEAAADLWLSDEHPDSGHYFTGPLGRPITPEWDYRVWCEVLDEAGVDPARLHDARHFAATYLRTLGLSDSVITRILGWASESMIQVYDDVADEALVDAADKMGELWTRGAKKPPPPDQATDHATGDLAPVVDIFRRRRSTR